MIRTHFGLATPWPAGLRAQSLLIWMGLMVSLLPMPSFAGSARFDINTGSGRFLLPGGKGHEEKAVEIHYHKPRNYTPSSPILIVLPGAGRNGNTYRDSWVDESEAYGVVVLSPAYSDRDYDAAEYNFGGVLRNITMRNLIPDPNPRVYRLKDEDLRFEVNDAQDEWLFKDLDRLFDVAVASLGSKQTGYDLFGHSAGGQFLHRLVLFHPVSKARRIVAANSGFYTLPRLDVPLPFGLGGSPMTEQTLRLSFKRNLVVFLGELDDENETRGNHLRTPMADRQGIGRLARGKNFFSEGRVVATSLGAEFNWQIVVNPGVGHDHRKMGALAARHLYGP